MNEKGARIPPQVPPHSKTFGVNPHQAMRISTKLGSLPSPYGSFLQAKCRRGSCNPSLCKPKAGVDAGVETAGITSFIAVGGIAATRRCGVCCLFGESGDRGHAGATRLRGFYDQHGNVLEGDNLGTEDSMMIVINDCDLVVRISIQTMTRFLFPLRLLYGASS